MKPTMKKSDERELVAKELIKFFERCEKLGIERDYSAYLAFCVIGGTTLEYSPEDFNAFVSEIVAKNVA